jgi:saccharopine dehydrogenase-like NADP-dependent oxidoreductase
MKILVVGAGGVGASMASIAETRSFFDSFVLADISRERAEQAIAELDDPGKFSAEVVDAGNVKQLVALIEKTKVDVVVNACDPRFNESIFEACYQAKCGYMDMAMNLSTPHPTDPYNQVGTPLGEDQLNAHDTWKERGILALVGMGVEPGLSDVFARYAADHIFDEVHEIGGHGRC